MRNGVATRAGRAAAVWSLIWLASGLSGGAALGQAPAQTPFRPVATVNQAVITAWDVDQRARILTVLGAQPQTEQQLASLALDRLIENRLMIQAGRGAGLEPNEEIVEAGLNEFAARADLPPSAFRERMARAGVSDQALADLVGPQLVWREVVQSRYRNRIEPGEGEIDAEIALMAAQASEEFNLSEIALPIEGSTRDEAETRALAARLATELQAGGSFEAAVRQYSRSPSAPRGGDLGWVEARNLPVELVSALATLEPGEVTPPLRVTGGFAILRLDGRRATQGTVMDASDPELREQVRSRLINQRIELLAQGLIQELRRDALIELR